MKKTFSIIISAVVLAVAVALAGCQKQAETLYVYSIIHAALLPVFAREKML